MNLSESRPTADTDDIFTRGRPKGWDQMPSVLIDDPNDADWAPSIRMSETCKDYLVKIELYGVDKDDIDITFYDGALIIKGERKRKNLKYNDPYHQFDNAYGKFFRSFRLQDDSDINNIEACFKRGQLRIFVPKTSNTIERVMLKKIRIS